MPEFGEITEVLSVALICDVVRSRRVPDREKLQDRLLAEITDLNDDLRESLASPIALTAGDEIQALFARPDAAVEVVVRLSESISPERLACGLGYGKISTEIYQDVALIDGSCFHRARRALEEAGNRNWVTSSGFGDPDDRVLTALFSLMNSVRCRWTETQTVYVRAARRMSQKQVARERGVSPSTVSESLKASSFSAVREGEAAAREMLRRFGPRSEVDRDSGESAK